MAIMLFFKKVQEDDRQVEYTFGDLPTTRNRRLAIDKASQEVTALDNLRDAQFRTAAGRILLQWTRSGAWPEAGSHQA